MKKIKLILIIMFFTSLLVPTLFLNTKSNQVSLLDNRNLKEFPDLTKPNSSTLKGIYSYYNDRYFGREFAINSYTHLMDHVFNILVHPVYTYGQNGEIYFFVDDEYKFNNYHQLFVDTTTKINSFLKSKNINFYVMIQPEKKSVYTNDIPLGVNHNRDMITHLETQLKNNHVSVIDPTTMLQEKAKIERVYDLKYDAGHWNDLGAFYSMQYLIEHIQKDFPNIKNIEKTDFNIQTEKRTALKSVAFPIDDTSPIFNLKNDDQYEELSSEYPDIYLNPNYQTFTYNHNVNSNGLRALVFQGSYLNGREKFLKPVFKDYITIHNYQNIFNVDYYVELFKPDIVIFEFAEYTLDETYFSSSIMKDMNLEK